MNHISPLIPLVLPFMRWERELTPLKSINTIVLIFTYQKMYSSWLLPFYRVTELNSIFF